MPRRSLCSQELSKLPPTARSGRLVLTLLIALLTTATAWAEYGGGTGTKDDPYRISGSYDLSTFANNVNNGYNYEDNYFVQTADINLATSSYWLGLPIGKDADNPFFYLCTHGTKVGEM